MRFSNLDITRALVFRRMKKLSDFLGASVGTVDVVDVNEVTLQLGDVYNLRSNLRNTRPVPRSHDFLYAVHADIVFGLFVGFGGYRYALMFTYHATHYRYIFCLCSMLVTNLQEDFTSFLKDLGALSKIFYTDFDTKIIQGEAKSFL